MSEQTDLAAADIEACLPLRRDAPPEYRDEYNRLAALTFPVCPDCGAQMRPRQAKATGSWFWGCSGFPECKRTKAWDRPVPLTAATTTPDQAICVSTLSNGHLLLEVLADENDLEVWHEADGWHTRH